ncbi:MAG: PBP1A family penicillin-binding protein [Actinomycetota bacterium]
MSRRAAIAAVCALLASAGCSYEIPELSAPIPEDAESSVAVDADGAELFVFHGVENRDSVPLSQMPAVLQDAVLAIEDHRFREHAGVDVRATMRALRANVEEGEVVEGGSTITQQYVKNALVGSDRTLDRKVREAAVAFQLEQRLSKDEILELYLNTIYFGAGAYGVQAAAQEFFGVDVGELDLGQSALLAGLIRAPSTYDPFRAPELATERRDLVIGRMEELGWIDAATADAVTSRPIELRQRTVEERYDSAYFVEEVRRFLLTDERFGETFEERRDLLFAGGLRIETSLDARLQAQAELAVQRVLPDPGVDPDVAVVVIDPSTGWVRAVVGGHDFFDEEAGEAKLNLATQGRRPTGSAFKPIVLAAALDEGIGLDQTYEAPPLMEFELPDGVWEVENYGGSGGGTVDLVEATVFSYNTAYAQLVLDVGPTDATRMASRLGITSPMLAVPSSVLGTNDVSPLELTSAYATFAAGGIHRPPAFVTRVSDRDGTVLYQWQDEGQQVLDRVVADQVTGVLTQVVGRGTGVNARIGRPVAGKTGTGQEWGDAWFVGYTPELVTGVWVGFADGQVPMVPPTTRETVTGGSWPAQIWQSLMGDALVEVPVSEFTPAVLPEPTEPDVAEDESGVAEVVPEGQGVPDVVGLPEAPATETLARAGLLVEVLEVPDDQYPPGIVAATEPVPGAARPDDDVVIVRVANGERVPRSPEVLGRTAASVLPELEGRFTLDVIETADPDADAASALPGVIWKVEPAGGSPLGPDQPVTIWVNPG